MMFEDSGSKSFGLDIENMKVVDIKKRLKALGLSTTGVKSDLVERLQDALLSGKDEVEYANMETAFLPDSAADSSSSKINDLLLEENLSPLKERDLSQETQDQTVSSAASTAVPLKKRALVQAEADSEPPKPKKKLVINRNNIPTPKLFVLDEPLKTELNVQLDNIDNGKNEEINPVKIKEKTEVIDNSGSMINVIRLATVETNKDLSNEEKVLMRAKRFNLAPVSPKPKRTLDPEKRRQIMQWTSKVAESKPLAPVPNLELLKKRAERFGENVSTVLKQIEDQEKINKRKNKFLPGSDNVSSFEPAEEEKKKKRAERFGNAM